MYKYIRDLTILYIIFGICFIIILCVSGCQGISIESKTDGFSKLYTTPADKDNLRFNHSNAVGIQLKVRF